jgi:hypothetical protein
MIIPNAGPSPCSILPCMRVTLPAIVPDVRCRPGGALFDDPVLARPGHEWAACASGDRAMVEAMDAINGVMHCQVPPEEVEQSLCAQYRTTQQ